MEKNSQNSTNISSFSYQPNFKIKENFQKKNSNLYKHHQVSSVSKFSLVIINYWSYSQKFYKITSNI